MAAVPSSACGWADGGARVWCPAVAGDVLNVTAPDGRRLQAVAAGPVDGTLVLMHHGTPGSATRIYPPHLELAEQRGLRLAGYSRPGYGDSDRRPGRTVADCAADAAAVADALGAGKFLTVGGSGGGPHALACAALLGDRIGAAATVAGAAPPDAEGLDWLEGMAEENLEEFAAARAGEEQLREFIDRYAADLREVKGDEILDSLGSLVSPPDAAALTGEYAEFAARSMRESVRTGIWGWFDDDLALLGDWGFDPGAIGAPVSIWQGRQDRFVPPSHGEWLTANVGRSRGHLLDEHGHLSLALAHFGAILDELVEASS
jgi:pimeloyl-ACP methyl ester carboxylesterase